MRKPEWLTADLYHKVIVSTIQATLTLSGIVIAILVLVVHYENSERARTELDNRIEKLNDFAKRLETQATKLKDQEKALRRMVTTQEQTAKALEGTINLAERQASLARDQMNVTIDYSVIHQRQLDYRSGKLLFELARGQEINTFCLITALAMQLRQTTSKNEHDMLQAIWEVTKTQNQIYAIIRNTATDKFALINERDKILSSATKVQEKSKILKDYITKVVERDIKMETDLEPNLEKLVELNKKVKEIV